MRLLLTIAVALALAACSATLAPTASLSPTPTERAATTPTPTASPAATPSPTPFATATPTTAPPVAVSDAPERNWDALVKAYLGRTVQPLSTSRLYPNEPVGTKQTFWVYDLKDDKMVQVPATLTLVSGKALWYVADSLSINGTALTNAANALDDTIFPHDKQVYAPDANIPGKITILNADIPGLGGYFSSSDAQSTDAYRYSNERMMLVMNGTGSVGSQTYQGTLAHELSHLMYYLVDPTEATWVSEGTAEMAATSLGLPALPYQDYLTNPSVSFSSWPDDPGQAISAYAGASLFASYLASRTGLDNIEALVKQPLDGAEGVGAYLRHTIGESFDAFFSDWLVADLVGATSGQYSYSNGVPGRVSVTRTLDGPGSLNVDIGQLSGAYVSVNPGTQPLRITFDGETDTPVLPVTAHSGNSCWWANRGDSIDSTLTRQIDLSSVSSATLTFWTWYDIEQDFDHAYVSVSTDGGKTWHALPGTHTTNADPVGGSLGNSYTGQSGGWTQEHVDLSKFAGRKVLLRFEYVTDESVNNAGWCIDDIAIPEIGFADDAVSQNGWNDNGFVLAPNAGVPQTYVVRTVQGTGNNAVVTDEPLDASNDATFVVDAPTTVIVAALTPRTYEPTNFTLTAARP